MYGSTGLPSKKQKPTTTGYLVRPRFNTLRSIYSNRPISAYPPEKRKKTRKSSIPKMEWKRKPDYADTAYREAVGRLRILLAESYAPVAPLKSISRPLARELDSAGEETDNQSLLSAGSRTSRAPRSYYHYNPVTPRKYYYSTPLKSTLNTAPRAPETEKPVPPEVPKYESSQQQAPPELMSFIERQEDYIEQLEKESRFCREELSSLLSKVKDVISENETLHEKQKSRMIKSVFEHLDTETETETDLENGKSIHKSPKKSRKTLLLDGPSIVFESRISELEAQLTQTRIDLKKSLEENENLKRKISDGTIFEGTGYESYRKQLDTLQREKEALNDKVQTLQIALSKLRDKENDTCDQVKRSLDVAEQAQYEKSTAELEIRRLKDELERQHAKLRDTIADQGRRVADERSAVERRYTQQIEQLTTELGVQWEQTNKLQLELDKQRRENGDLRRELAQKQALIDELKKDMQNKIITLQSDIGVSGAEKSALEQQIASLQMANERTERQSKQEIARLQAEIQSLRQRLDRADADLIHSRRENIRLTEQVASLEKEINMSAALADERGKTTTPRGGETIALPPPKEDREKEVASMIQDMESKHAATVAELESMIRSQNQLMDALSDECKQLTAKLDDVNVRHKEEIRELQTSLDRLNNKLFRESQSPSGFKGEDSPKGGTPPTTQRPPSATPPRQRPSPQRDPKISRSESKSSLRPSRKSSRQNSQEKPSSPKQAPARDQQYSPDQPAAAPQDYPPQQYDYDPNQPYDPAQQYDYDPNQQYDPSQQYDPAQQYEYDPNQQYEGAEVQQYQEDTARQYEDNQQYEQAQYVDPNQQQYYGDQQYDSGQAPVVEEKPLQQQEK